MALSRKAKFLDLARVPEFIFIVITLGLIISIVVAQSFEPTGVYLEDLPIGDGIGYQAVTAGAILIVISVLFVSAWMRSFRRKLDSTVSPIYVFLCSKKIDMYYILCIVNYILAIFWTLGAYTFFEDTLVLVLGFIMPAILFCFFNIFIVYVKNGYFYIENTASLNHYISAHNKRVDILKIKAKKLRT